jgi:hypothetical protein
MTCDAAMHQDTYARFARRMRTIRKTHTHDLQIEAAQQLAEFIRIDRTSPIQQEQQQQEQQQQEQHQQQQPSPIEQSSSGRQHESQRQSTLLLSSTVERARAVIDNADNLLKL